MKLCIQAGHQNIKYNSIVALRGSTGAPGEADFNIDVANQVCAQLRLRGFEVIQTDANANADPKVTQTNFDLFLAIHYDADVYSKPGGFVDFAEPSTDAVTLNSQAIAKALSEEYFSTTGIESHPERSNPNTRYYYMWRNLTNATPCVLIECGIGNRYPEDHNLFTYHREKVVEGIVRGVCKAFLVKYDLAVEPTCQERVDQAVAKAKAEEAAVWQTKLETANQQIEALRKLAVSSFTWRDLISIAMKKMWQERRG